jgi:pimeloyl-ACP methyl ester carboxylesterase
MKLAQRMAIGYYKTKINTLSIVSKRRAAKIAFQLFCKPYSKVRLPQPASFAHASNFSFKSDGLTLYGWHWKAAKSNHQTILIAHGLNSSSYKFEKYIILLQKAGFDVVAFDAPAHGISEGKYIHSLAYKNAIIAVNHLFGQLHGIMAHSLGALAASLAAEALPHLQKLVLIAPATESTRALNNFVQMMSVKPKTHQAIERLIVQISQQPIAWFSVSRAVKNFTIPTLWLHDLEDPICPFEDVQPVIDAHLSHIDFFITKGQGHSNIYRDASSVKKILSFFKSGEV